jgi:hypothetical protein
VVKRPPPAADHDDGETTPPLSALVSRPSAGRINERKSKAAPAWVGGEGRTPPRAQQTPPPPIVEVSLALPMGGGGGAKQSLRPTDQGGVEPYDGTDGPQQEGGSRLWGRLEGKEGQKEPPPSVLVLPTDQKLPTTPAQTSPSSTPPPLVSLGLKRLPKEKDAPPPSFKMDLPKVLDPPPSSPPAGNFSTSEDERLETPPPDVGGARKSDDVGDEVPKLNKRVFSLARLKERGAEREGPSGGGGGAAAADVGPPSGEVGGAGGGLERHEAKNPPPSTSGRVDFKSRGEQKQPPPPKPLAAVAAAPPHVRDFEPPLPAASTPPPPASKPIPPVAKAEPPPQSTSAVPMDPPPLPKEEAKAESREDRLAALRQRVGAKAAERGIRK